jgi:DNA invertase Pin-like site-specific DNA recombinase
MTCQQAIDSSTPAGKALFGMFGIFAEFEQEIIRERVISGLERAKANGVRLGRKPVAPITVKQIHELRAKGMTQTVNSNKGRVSQTKVCSILKPLVQM